MNQQQFRELRGHAVVQDLTGNRGKVTATATGATFGPKKVQITWGNGRVDYVDFHDTGTVAGLRRVGRRVR